MFVRLNLLLAWRAQVRSATYQKKSLTNINFAVTVNFIKKPRPNSGFLFYKPYIAMCDFAEPLGHTNNSLLIGAKVHLAV